MKTYEQSILLPSNGLFGGPKEVTLRAMTTKEEKIMLMSKDFSVFEKIVKSCCVKPKDLDVGLLHQNDILYLTYALRQITFGDDYTQESVCPECGYRQQIDVNISEMEVNYLDTDDIEEKLAVTLPINKDTLTLKLLSNGDVNRLDKLVKVKNSKGKLQDPESYRFTLGLMELIVTRNGEEFTDIEEKRNYVDNLHLQDLVTIQNCVSKIEFGLDNTIIRTCQKCGEEIKLKGIICPEFFRPSL